MLEVDARTGGRTHGQTGEGNDNTGRPKLTSGKNDYIAAAAAVTATVVVAVATAAEPGKTIRPDNVKNSLALYNTEQKTFSMT